MLAKNNKVVKGDGVTTCSRCGKPKEDNSNSYCKECRAENYQRGKAAKAAKKT